MRFFQMGWKHQLEILSLGELVTLSQNETLQVVEMDALSIRQ